MHWAPPSGGAHRRHGNGRVRTRAGAQRHHRRVPQPRETVSARRVGDHVDDVTGPVAAVARRQAMAGGDRKAAEDSAAHQVRRARTT